MTERWRLLDRLHTLAEIRDIMNSMKILALLESRKLARYLDNQQQALAVFDDAGADFLQFFSPPRTALDRLKPVYLVFGAERGFNGDFNLRLIDTVNNAAGDKPGDIIVVGSRLAQRMEGDERVVDAVVGPAVAEDVGACVNALVAAILKLTDQRGPLALLAIHHTNERDGIHIRSVFPPFQEQMTTDHPGYPPELNLPPRQFFAQLVEAYLFSVLHGLFFLSLSAENQQRMDHLDGAVRRLDERSEQVDSQQRILRQEEITEEIEVILLSAEASTSTRWKPDT